MVRAVCRFQIPEIVGGIWTANRGRAVWGRLSARAKIRVLRRALLGSANKLRTKGPRAGGADSQTSVVRRGRGRESGLFKHLFEKRPVSLHGGALHVVMQPTHAAELFSASGAARSTMNHLWQYSAGSK